jgi:hypothetical protein
VTFVEGFPQFVERRPCEFCKPPCGNLAEGVAFADGIHFVCPRGIETWNSKHEKKIVPHGT